MDELIFAGNKYISSKRASKLTGYTADYIGQICRADKIECRLVGRNWYINEREIERNKKSFKKEQTIGYGEPSGTINYEKIGPELLYYSNDKRSLNPEISKIHTGDVEENNEENIPVRIIKNPEVSVQRYPQSRIIPKTKKQTAVIQRTVPQQTNRILPMAAAVALVLMLIGAVFIAGTLTLEQTIHYSSKDKTNIDTSFQLANVTNFLKF